MSVRYEVRQRVCNVLGCRLDVVASGEFERPVRDAFERLKKAHPREYFEFIEVLHTEQCLDFTPLVDGPQSAQSTR